MRDLGAPWHHLKKLMCSVFRDILISISEPIRKTVWILFDFRARNDLVWKFTSDQSELRLIRIETWFAFIRIDALDCIGLSRIDFQSICIKRNSKRSLDRLWMFALRQSSQRFFIVFSCLLSFQQGLCFKIFNKILYCVARSYGVRFGTRTDVFRPSKLSNRRCSR